MKVTAIKTSLARPGGEDLIQFLETNLQQVAEGSVLAISSKVAAICEGRAEKIDPSDLDKNRKKELAVRESDYYLSTAMSKYNFTFTIAHKTLIPNAGIDESNGDGYYILWPKHPVGTCNQVREYLVQRFGVKNIGVILTDSTARPLHYGTEGVCIGYSGFSPSKNYIGKRDLFGREMNVSISNIADMLASSAVLVMGEGTEQTPLALVEDVPFVQFQDHNPTEEELAKFFINHYEDDLFEPFLKNAGWQSGGRLDENFHLVRYRCKS